MQTLYHIVKILHIMGFVSAIGITLATAVAYTQFWKLYAVNREQGLAAFRAFKALQWVGMVGFLVVLLAGITMLAIMKWSFLSFLWFQVKLGLIVLIFTNGIVFGRTSTLKFEAFIATNEPSSDSTHATQIQTSSRRFLIVQLGLYCLIIIVSVLRFI